MAKTYRPFIHKGPISVASVLTKRDRSVHHDAIARAALREMAAELKKMTAALRRMTTTLEALMATDPDPPGDTVRRSPAK